MRPEDVDRIVRAISFLSVPLFAIWVLLLLVHLFPR